MVLRAQTADPIERNWYNDKKTAKINIFKAADGRYCGKIIWLKEPNEDGKPKADKHNPDHHRRTDPILGLMILKGFKKEGDNIYNEGTIYDPNNGHTYSCTIKREGNELNVRGYMGISLLGRTTRFTPAD